MASEDEETTERTGLLSGSGPQRRASSLAKKKANYKSFRFAQVYDPNPKTYFTKTHAWLSVLLVLVIVAWITTSLVIGLPLVRDKMAKYKELNPDQGDSA